MQTYELECDQFKIMVSRKTVKNINLRISRTDASIKLSIPKYLDDTSVCEFIRAKRRWILQKQSDVLATIKQSSPQTSIDPIYYFLGKPYTLHIVDIGSGKPSVELQSGTLLLKKPLDCSLQTQQATIQQWYKQQMKMLLDPMIEHWQQRMGVTVNHCSIRQMKTRWGSCTPATGRIRMNLALIKKPLPCMEYVLVHELVHFYESGHNLRFYAMMDKFLPDWRGREGLLRRKIEVV